MQREALASNALITLVQAPTGAGKSYVMRRMVQAGQRVLFFVPTKRLGQNLVSAMREEMVRPVAEGGAGWSVREAEQKIVCWDADYSAEIRQLVQAPASKHYAAKLPSLNLSARGEIIFATPELINHLLLHPVRSGARGDVGPLLVVAAFHAIIFDEFHLIESRGFGLLAYIAGVAMAKRAQGEAAGGVMLLSATPVDVRPVLSELGFDVSLPEEFRMIEERLLPQGRTLHGDVQINFVRAQSPLEVMTDLGSDLVQEGSRSLVIYDSLRELSADERTIAASLDRWGIGRSGLLIDSSLHGQRVTEISGRHHDLSTRDLIVATSTVEVGVTIPGLTTLISQPGWSPLSMMQRIGRVARGSDDGRVFIAVSDRAYARNPWVSRVIDAVRVNGATIHIQQFTKLLLEAAKLDNRFNPDEPAGAGIFGTMGRRAVFASGAYWNLALTRIKEAKLAQQHAILSKMAPKGPTGFAQAKLDDIRLRGSGGEWISAFQAECEQLRGFSPTIKIIEDDEGERPIVVQEKWLVRNTVILDEFPVTLDEQGSAVVRINRTISDYMRPGRDFGSYSRRVIMPDGARADLGNEPLQEYCSKLKKATKNPAASSSQRRAYEAAHALVAATGLLPWIDDDGGVRVDNGRVSVVL